MSTAQEIAFTLKRDGYNLSTLNAAIMALQEDLGYSESEAISVADEVIKAARGI